MQYSLSSSLRASVVMLAVFTLLTGFVYPLAVTGFAQGLFSQKANGSLVVRDGIVIGSELLGQEFTSPRYFWGRPTVEGEPSNLSPGNLLLAEQMALRLEKLVKAHGNAAPPADMLSASASGMDPHISEYAAQYQAARVAKARGMSEKDVRMLIDRTAESSLLSFGDRRLVNVLRLNLALDGYAQAAPE